MTKAEIISLLKSEGIQHSYQGSTRTFFLSTANADLMRTIEYWGFKTVVDKATVSGTNFSGSVKRIKQNLLRLNRTGVHLSRAAVAYITRKGKILAMHTPKSE